MPGTTLSARFCATLTQIDPVRDVTKGDFCNVVLLVANETLGI